MTYAVGERAQPGPAGTQEAAQTHASGPSPQGIRAGVVLFDQFGPVYTARTTSGADTFHVCPSGQTQWPSSLIAMLPDKQARDMGKAGQLKNTRLRMAPAHCFDQFGPVYLDRMQSGAAAPRVQSDPSASLVMIAETPPAGAAQAAAAGAFSEGWE